MSTASMRDSMTTALIALGATAMLLMSACSSEADQVTTETPPQATSALANENSLQAQLLTPGTLTVAVFDDSPPGAFYTDDDRLIGWEIELVNDLAKRLGLEVTFVGGSFGSVLDAVETGSADVGIASIFDTQERQQRVDFVNYFVGGTSWASRAESDFTPIDPCGSRVGAVSGSAQFQDYLPRVSEQCISSGSEPITAVPYDSLTPAVADIATGRIDAIVADDPVITHLANQSFGRLSVVETYVEAQPYGIAVAKGNSRLSEQLQSGLQSSGRDGTYADLLGRWGLEAGAVKEFTINGEGDLDVP